MAGHKGQGSSSNGRNSPGQRLGIKVFGGQTILAGGIIARQRGTKWHPAVNVGIAKDDTLFALQPGIVTFGKRHGRVTVSVLPAPSPAKP